MPEHQGAARRNLAEWHRHTLVGRHGELRDASVDAENDEPQFGTVRDGFVGRPLTCMPVGGIQVGRDDLRMARERKRASARAPLMARSVHAELRPGTRS